MIDTNDNQIPINALALAGAPLPVDFEFKPTQMTEIFENNRLPMGRCFGSKSGYRRMHPNCDFIPNANVFTKRHGKIWFGDLDLVVDIPALESIAKRLRRRLYVLIEQDGRFGQMNRPHTEIVADAIWRTGGLSEIPGIRRFFRLSGLGCSDAAILLKISRRSLNRPQPPKAALEIGRRMKMFEEIFSPIALDAGQKKWGLWWRQPKEKLAGKSPLQTLKSGEPLNLGQLTDLTIRQALFAIRYNVMEHV